MKLMHELLAGFVIVSIFAGIVGLLGLYANYKIVSVYEGGEKQFGSVVEASNEVSSFAKRAEGHLMLYLALHDDKDRQKFFLRLEGLRNQTLVIDERVKDPDARNILANIISKTGELQSVGESLIAAYANETKAAGNFDQTKYEQQIRKLDDVAAGIRRDGLELAKTEIRLQAEQQAAAKKNAALLHNAILAISLIAVISALSLGYIISGKISWQIEKLKNAAGEISKGNFSTTLERGSSDELSDLAGMFNKMSTELQNSGSEIAKREEALEKSKKELQAKVAELERLNKLTLGRELRMIELKKRIAELDRK